MFIVGDKEKENGTVSVRSRKDGDKGDMALEEISKILLEENRTKKA